MASQKSQQSVSTESGSALQTATGKRTYADALSSSRVPTDSTPASLQRDGRRCRRRRMNMPSSEASVVRRLWARQLGHDIPPPTVHFTKERFSNFKLKASLDTHNMQALADKIPWLRIRSKVIEIVSSRDLIFALTNNGVCVAFCRRQMKRICFLNVTDDEVVRSLFLNRTNDSLITVSVFKKDDFSSLRCRTTPLEQIANGCPQLGRPIFESEVLRWPGFVEFDDVNGKIFTFSAEDSKYKVWDLKTYRLLYTIVDDLIQEIKVSPGVMLLVYNRQDSHVPIRIINIETGKKIKEINYLLNRKRKIDFIEQFHEKLLVKQEHENLQILDIRTGDTNEVDKSHLLTPSAFMFLYESELFLTFQQRNICVWNFQGERVSDFEDHTLYRSDASTSSIYITQNQDVIISYCRQHYGCQHGAINFSLISTGKLLGKITCDSSNSPGHAEVLEDVTALYFNEERNEIYSGDPDGLIHVWSN